MRILRISGHENLRFYADDNGSSKVLSFAARFSVERSHSTLYVFNSNAFGGSVEQFWENVQTIAVPSTIVADVHIFRSSGKVYFTVSRSNLAPPSRITANVLRRAYGRTHNGSGVYSNIYVSDGVVMYNRNVTFNSSP